MVIVNSLDIKMRVSTKSKIENKRHWIECRSKDFIVESGKHKASILIFTSSSTVSPNLTSFKAIISLKGRARAGITFMEEHLNAKRDYLVFWNGTLAKIHGKFLASLAKILPWSCHDLGKDTMAMQDRAKANHD